MQVTAAPGTLKEIKHMRSIVLAISEIALLLIPVFLSFPHRVTVRCTSSHTRILFSIHCLCVMGGWHANIRQWSVSTVSALATVQLVVLCASPGWREADSPQAL